MGDCSDWLSSNAKIDCTKKVSLVRQIRKLSLVLACLLMSDDVHPPWIHRMLRQAAASRSPRVAFVRDAAERIHDPADDPAAYRPDPGGGDPLRRRLAKARRAGAGEAGPIARDVGRPCRSAWGRGLSGTRACKCAARQDRRARGQGTFEGDANGIGSEPFVHRGGSVQFAGGDRVADRQGRGAAGYGIGCAGPLAPCGGPARHPARIRSRQTRPERIRQGGRGVSGSPISRRGSGRAGAG